MLIEAIINKYALKLISEITAFAYDSVGDSPEDKLTRDAYLYSIQGIVEFAQNLQEALKDGEI